jgi:MFS family permease
VPLSLFRDRNFSLASLAISVMGFSITAMAIPIMLWAQVVRGLSPTRSALLLVPMAVMTIVLARPVGGLTDRVHPRLLTGTGFVGTIASLLWLAAEMIPDVSIWALVPPMVLLGVGNAFIWAPNSATATRNLPLHQAGAGSGVYNATRQVGAVLGSAAIAVLIDARLAAEGLPAFTGSAEAGGRLPGRFVDGFNDAMAGSMLLPAFVLVLGLAASLAFERPRHAGYGGAAGAAASAAASGDAGSSAAASAR